MKRPLTLLLLLLSITLHGQEKLTSAIDNDLQYSSTPDKFFSFNGSIYFLASEKSTGREIWKTDGTTAGTVLVSDINPGAADLTFVDFIEANNTLYFIADDGVRGKQFWTTDGTKSGTKMLTTNLTQDLISPVACNGSIYFISRDEALTLTLWKFDGTSNPTIVKSGIVNNTTANIMTSKLGMVFLLVSSAYPKYTLWRSDGTEAGTFPIEESVYRPKDAFVEYHGALYFVARTSNVGVPGFGLMKTDGTVAGTGYFANDLVYGQANLIAITGTVHNDKMYFQSFERDVSLDVIESDGTLANTQVVHHESEPHLWPSHLLSADDGLYFLGSDANDYTVLKRLTPSGVTSIRELKQNTQLPSDSDFLDIYSLADGKIGLTFFESATYRFSLWQSDGTSNGTKEVVKMYTSDFEDIPSYTLMNGTVYFPGVADYQCELWKSNGSATSLVSDINSGNYGLQIQSDLVKLSDDVAVMSVYSLVTGTELWKTDASSSGTKIIEELSTVHNGLDLREFHTIGNKVYFFGDGEEGGAEVYVSDGTAEGTYKLASWNGTSMRPISMCPVSDDVLILFTADMTNTQMWLLNTDGTRENLGNLPDDASITISNIQVLGNEVYFVSDSYQGILFRTDLTLAGTTKIMTADRIGELAIAGDRLFFVALDNSSEKVFTIKNDWSSAVEVKTTTEDFFTVTKLTPFGDKVVFVYNDATSGLEPWITDGTAENTALLADVNKGQGSSVNYFSSFIQYDGFLYFAGFNEESGNELWKTDGSSEGTTLVKDLALGQIDSNPKNLTVLGDHLYFSAYTEGTGMEAWQSDGTQDGTVLFADIAPGTPSSSPDHFAKVNGFVVFSATTNSTQLYAHTFDRITGLESQQSQFSFYPNPTTVAGTLHAPGWNKGILQLINTAGQVVRTQEITGDEMTLSFAELPRGLYIAKVVQGNRIGTFRVAVK